ncbi:hypothetical protein U9M48_023174, partial [Paspalum notatum var. saurae]
MRDHMERRTSNDGIENLFLLAPIAKKFDESTAEFLVNKVSNFPREVLVLAVGPLTNAALVLIHGDPEAVDVAFTSGADMLFAALVHPKYFTFKKGVLIGQGLKNLAMLVSVWKANWDKTQISVRLRPTNAAAQAPSLLIQRWRGRCDRRRGTTAKLAVTATEGWWPQQRYSRGRWTDGGNRSEKWQ